MVAVLRVLTRIKPSTHRYTCSAAVAATASDSRKRNFFPPPQEKAFLDDRAKRRGIFEAEIRTLKGGIDELCSKFDEALLTLAVRKLAVHTEALHLEMRIILLAGCAPWIGILLA